MIFTQDADFLRIAGGRGRRIQASPTATRRSRSLGEIIDRLELIWRDLRSSGNGESDRGFSEYRG